MSNPTYYELRLDLARALSAYDDEVTERRAEVGRCHRELGALRADLARVAAERDETKEELELSKEWQVRDARVIRKFRAGADRLRKAWALRELQTLAVLFPTPAELERFLANVPPEVAALIREHAGTEIGQCDECKDRAPLAEDATDPSKRYCAWGCAKGGASG